jgi:hypothetical protein
LARRFRAAKVSSAALTARSNKGTGSTIKLALPAPSCHARSSGVATIARERSRVVKRYLLRNGLIHDKRALTALSPRPNASHVPTTISATKS